MNRALKCDVEEKEKEEEPSILLEEKTMAFARHATPPLLFPAKSSKSLHP